MPECIVLVGVPASGKSTFIERFYNTGTYRVCSSDNVIDARARELGKTYDEVFDEVVDTAEKVFWMDVELAVANDVNLIVDRTNLTPRSRKRLLDKIPKHYSKTAYVFATPEENDWRERLNSRPGKTIPPHVLDSMVKCFTPPTREEGFDYIIVC